MKIDLEHNVDIFDPTTDLEPEVDLEFKVRTCEYHRDVARDNDATIQDWLNDGWQIDDKIICPPFVTIILSREKETTDNE